jgi:hypothetical protein
VLILPENGPFFVKYKTMAKGNPHPVGRRKAGVPNKVNTARVERAVREGKRLPPGSTRALLILFGTPTLRNQRS